MDAFSSHTLMGGSGVHKGGSRSSRHRQAGTAPLPSITSLSHRRRSNARTSSNIAAQKLVDSAAQNRRHAALSLEEQRLVAELADAGGLELELEGYGDNDDWEDDQMQGVLEGEIPLAMSHEGGEGDALSNLYHHHLTHRRIDYRTRTDRTEKTFALFAEQLDKLTDAYMAWDYASTHSQHPAPLDGGFQHSLKVIDVFDAHTQTVSYDATADLVCAAFARNGIICCSPTSPTVGISMNVLKLFHTAHLQCPQFSVQPFVKVLSALHTVHFRRYLATQFSIAYDVYVAILAEVNKRVQKALRRDEPNWRLKHACPACTSKLQGQLDLDFSMLLAMDGNDSLKRLLRRSPSDNPEVVGPCNERVDTRQVEGDFYISREDVNKYARELVEESKKLEASDPDYNPCAERWKNMIDEITNRMWGIFDETGVFVVFCRHGFALVVADMVRSGEQTKYPLACVDKLLNVFGRDLGVGYDTGCQFKTRLNNSSLGPLARTLRYRSLVDLFHCHAHRRLCQLDNLPTYTTGVGLEDLGMCERAFSKSNALAGTTRHMSVFHRKQAISLWFANTDNLETYQNLTTFILNNYRQALETLDKAPSTLARVMDDLHINNHPSVFDDWLVEERQYLQGLTQEPEEETFQIEYYQKLCKLWASQASFAASQTVWSLPGPGITDSTRITETKRRHLMETLSKNLEAVQILESRLRIEFRWLEGGAECAATAKLVAMRKYQRSIDVLEGLIVSRIFELSKANRSQTGYALRKHIGDALQKRSAAVRSALDKYNAAAKALIPPRRTLKWEEVVSYAFLSDFDLLRDTRQDIRQRPWATPAGRLALDTHFKILRAREELTRCNQEVQRVATHLVDENIYLRLREDDVKLSNPNLAHQIFVYRMIRGRFDDHHHRRLHKISLLPGFDGSIVPGISIECANGSPGVASKADRGLSGWREQAVNVVDSDEVKQQEQEEEEEELAEQELKHGDDVLDMMHAMNSLSLV